jgi:REP element-mobilizing transposase RayT
MPPTPLYDGNVDPAYQLRYGWTGWPTPGRCFSPEIEKLLPALAKLWEGDGLRLLEQRCVPSQLQLTFSTLPNIAPVLLSGRVKGRLQHAFRESGCPVPFSRNLAVRSIGTVCREAVERYVRSQVPRAKWAATEFGERMRQFTVVNPKVDLSAPTQTERGMYWYNLHLVLVTIERYQRGDSPWLTKIRDQSLRIAEHKGYPISRLAVMPDHLHVALRGNVADSPQQIVLAFQNNLAYALGQVFVWQPTYYVGTFSEYDMGAVRQRRNEAEPREPPN